MWWIRATRSSTCIICEHPTTKNTDNENGMSVGFTSHYTSMRDRFGPHLVDGIAGENVLVAVDDQIEPEQLLDGLDIALQDGRKVHLEHIIVAEPCIEFTRYALRLDPMQPGGEACTAACGSCATASAAST